MKQEDKIKEVAGKGSPFRVPDNYFESFKADLMSKLPEYPEKPEVQKVSVWHRVRPYVYLAAMFAGIWCMMKIFHKAGGIDGAVGHQYEGELASLNYEPDSYEMFVSSIDGVDFELQDEITEIYSSMDEFKKDFYAASVD